MNIVLFDAGETASPLPRSDPRARHVLEVLRFGEGHTFDAGLIDGPRGKARIAAVDATGLRLEFTWDAEPPPLEPVTLLVGLPRPQTGRKLLEEATALGVAAMHFVTAQRGEASYAKSRLWSTGEWRRHLIAGAQQAFSTRLPEVSWGRSLSEALQELPREACCLAMDNYEAAGPLSLAELRVPVVLAVGPERGWSAAERNLLRGAGFALVHLGERVLRVETACIAALAIIRARLALM